MEHMQTQHNHINPVSLGNQVKDKKSSKKESLQKTPPNTKFT